MRAIRPDAQAFDKVVFYVKERYKESELSGDEWRIAVFADFYRKGVIVEKEVRIAHDMETAMGFAYHSYVIASENNGFFGGIGNKCDQEGCESDATTKLYLRKEYCKHCGISANLSERFRMFCDKHKERGDCGLEDSDGNYTESNEQ